eukprot:Platyproteum_vivax@DN3054_c0_g1_i1.p1
MLVRRLCSCAVSKRPIAKEYERVIYMGSRAFSEASRKFDRRRVKGIADMKAFTEEDSGPKYNFYAEGEEANVRTGKQKVNAVKDEDTGATLVGKRGSFAKAKRGVVLNGQDEMIDDGSPISQRNVAMKKRNQQLDLSVCRSLMQEQVQALANDLASVEQQRPRPEHFANIQIRDTDKKSRQEIRATQTRIKQAKERRANQKEKEEAIADGSYEEYDLNPEDLLSQKKGPKTPLAQRTYVGDLGQIIVRSTHIVVIELFDSGNLNRVKKAVQDTSKSWNVEAISGTQIKIDIPRMDDNSDKVMIHKYKMLYGVRKRQIDLLEHNNHKELKNRNKDMQDHHLDMSRLQTIHQEYISALDQVYAAKLEHHREQKLSKLH